MKTIEEIKDDVAIKNGYIGWFIIPSHLRGSLVEEVAEAHAKQCCDEQIKACAENAEAFLESMDMALVAIVDKESILNTPNVLNKQ